MQRQAEPELMGDRAEADAYAAADFAAVNAAFVERLLELAGDRADVWAVDLGAGPADIPVRVARARPDWRIVAVEAAPAMIEIARQAVAGPPPLSDRVFLHHADAKATGLPETSFDVILSNSILHHITQTVRLWAEVRRLARPGATVFFRDLARPDSEAGADRIAKRYAGTESQLLRDEYRRSLLSAYTVGEIRTQLARAGLDLQVAMSSDRHLDVWGTVASAERPKADEDESADHRAQHRPALDRPSRP
jgi:ubiquinone/menaquinone biosynthesis C-methylase UbiE